MLGNLTREFFRLEAAGGILLFVAAVLAVIVNNTSALAPFYQALFHAPVALGPLVSGHSLTHWINDGLMVIFFLLVGMEIKREVLGGQLSRPSALALPALAAAGGMAVPALIYVFINQGNPVAAPGWAIPTATDIAFALGVLMLLGSRVPASLKIFLTALAILDDLAAIVVIAVFYTAQLSSVALGLAALAIAALVLLNRFNVRRLWPYLVVGLALWYAVLNSGIHATVAGVVLAFTIPMAGAPGRPSPLEQLEHALHPWVGFAILPLFAFANAGLSLQGMGIDALLQPIPLGIAAGLFFGKQIGVFGAAALVIKLGWANLPAGASWIGLYGVSILCGIGFTMSLFIGSLAFSAGGAQLATSVQLGVFSGSLLAMAVGYGLLFFVGKPARPRGAST